MLGQVETAIDALGDVTNKGIKSSFSKASKVFADMAFWIRIDNVETCDK